MDTLKHKCFLEELLFWTIKYEFPQKMVTFLLNMLPDQDYKVFNATMLNSHICEGPNPTLNLTCQECMNEELLATNSSQHKMVLPLFGVKMFCPFVNEGV